jgi:hypothetical protein
MWNCACCHRNVLRANKFGDNLDIISYARIQRGQLFHIIVERRIFDDAKGKTTNEEPTKTSSFKEKHTVTFSLLYIILVRNIKNGCWPMLTFFPDSKSIF